jgi:hypothetical protein
MFRSVDDVRNQASDTTIRVLNSQPVQKGYTRPSECNRIILLRFCLFPALAY